MNDEQETRVVICGPGFDTGALERAVVAIRGVTTAMERAGMALVVNSHVMDKLKHCGVPTCGIEICDHIPKNRVVLVGGRGSGKNGPTADMIRMILEHGQARCHRGVHKNAELGGRTSKGDRRRKRMQWQRK